jgi:NitT/TauT family transport system substrate-binding protein
MAMCHARCYCSYSLDFRRAMLAVADGPGSTMMIDRRRTLVAGLAAGALPALAPLGALAQGKPRVTVRYNEVVRSFFFAPAYVAIANGYFEEVGIDVTISTAQGGDRSVAALLSNSADIALIGPETAIYVQNSDSPTKLRIFCGLTATDGYMLFARERVEKFDWSMLKGKEVLGFRPGSTPLLFLEAALRRNGIDPQKDLKLVNNIAIPARLGSWLAGQNQFAIFQEPEAIQLEMDGKAHFLASIGETVGFADYTCFIATDKYIRENEQVVQSWTNAIYKALRWSASAPSAELARTVGQFFPGIGPQVLSAGADRYRRLKIWKTSPTIEPQAIEKFQDILVGGQVLEPGKRVKYENLVAAEFAEKAK